MTTSWRRWVRFEPCRREVLPLVPVAAVAYRLRTVRGTVRIGWVLVAVAAIGAGCSSSDAGEVSATTVESSTTEVVTTSEATTSTTLAETTTTLSPEQIAEAEIEAVIKAWYEGPFDTSNGQAGLGLESLTDPLRQRRIDTQATRAAAGQIQRRSATSPPIVSVLLVTVTGASATASVCHQGGHELLDVETMEVLAVDAGGSWDGEVLLERVEGEWLVSEFFSGETNGGSRCEL